MSDKDTSELKDEITSIIYGADWESRDIAKAFKADVEAIMKLLHTSNIKAQISEIDFSQQYRDYTGRKYITEKMLEDRKKQLQHQLKELEEV